MLLHAFQRQVKAEIMSQCYTLDNVTQVELFTDLTKKNSSEADSYCRENNATLMTVTIRDDLRRFKHFKNLTSLPKSETWIGVRTTFNNTPLLWLDTANGIHFS